jgi:Arc/MetJ-type ribon-helix-helix transcriptional regulator
MTNTMYRAQILLEPEQHEALAEIARLEKRSISEVIREILREWLVLRDRQTQRQRELQALEELTLLRRKIQEEHGVYTGDFLAEARAEKEADIERVWRGEK